MTTDHSQNICIRCTHYYITHDTALPYGCRALRFVSRTSPWREVLAASGTACEYFKAKPAPPRDRED